MANVEKYLQDILDAVYGEEVRGSIHDAIEAMNVESTNAEAAAISSRESARNYATAAGEAKDSAEAAETAAQTAQTGAVNAKAAAEAANTAAQTAKTGAVNAQAAAEAAKTAAQTAKTGAETAQTGAVNAKTAAEAANTAAQTAKTGAVNAQTAAEAAKTSAQASATAAADSETNASSSETNAEHWADVAQQYAQGGLHFCGTVNFANIPTSGMSNGDEYNISEDFVTDNRFIEGPGIKVKTGTDIAWVENINETIVRKWNILATGESIDLTETTATGNPVSFTTDSSGISKDTIVTLEPIQSGSGDPSPTNVRPISGYNFVTVANQDGTDRSLSLESGALGARGVKVELATRCILTDFIPLKKGELIHLECTTTLSKTVNIALMLWSNNTYGSNDILHDVGWGPSSQIYYAKQDGYIMATVRYSDSSNISPNELTMKMMNASSITSPLPSTIYGGTYDVETGELTVDRALVDLGTFDFAYNGNRFTYDMKSLNPKFPNGTLVANIVCEEYMPISYRDLTDGTDNNVIAGMEWSANGAMYLTIRNTTYTDVASFKTAMSGVQLAYELATPYTIQLEPHLLNLFEGQNNVSTNGTQISVTYRNGIVARVDDFNAVGESFEALADKVKDVETDITTTSDTTPYIFHQTTENAVYDKLIGASVVKNQLVPKTRATGTDGGVTYTNNSDGSWTLTGTPNSDFSFLNLDHVTNVKKWVKGHKYYVNAKNNSSGNNVAVALVSTVTGTAKEVINKESVVEWTAEGETASWSRLEVVASSGIDIGTVKITPQIIDLTLMFGASIADKIYTMEQATAGSCIAWLKSYGFLSETYIPHNTGTITSVVAEKRVTRGFNQWDEEWEVGGIAGSTGQNVNDSGKIRSKNYNPAIPNVTYYFKHSHTGWLFYYDSNKEFVGSQYSGSSRTYTVPANCYYLRLVDDNTATYNHDICINISDAEKNGTYEPYNGVSYNLGSDTLRGLYTLDGDNLVANGDVKTNDGRITRNRGRVDLGSLVWTKNGTNRFTSNSSPAGISAPSTVNDVCPTVCAKYVASTFQIAYTEGADTIVAINTNGAVNVVDTAYSDATAFTTAMSGVYLEYPLATPTTEISTPFASPQVVLDTEEMISPIPVGHEASYVALPSWMQKKIFDDVIADATRVEDIAEDVSGKAESSALAPVENGVIASRAYAVGEHFYRDGAFCTAKTSIAKDSQFTLGTNYTAGTVADSVEYKVISVHPTESETASITLPDLWNEAIILAKYGTDTVATIHIVNGMPRGCAYRFSLNQEAVLAFGFVWFYSNSMRFELNQFTRKEGGTTTDLRYNTDVLFQIWYR